MKKISNNIKRQLRNRKKLKSVNVDRYRISIFKSLKNISAQIIDDKIQKTLVSASIPFSIRTIRTLRQNGDNQRWYKTRMKGI